MPFFEQDGVRLRYEIHGKGAPVLALAPGGMRSCAELWARSPWRPAEQLTERFTVVTMDQRNAGHSVGPIEQNHGWGDYARDQLAVMSHLGFETFSVIGMCIGGSYIASLCRMAPKRIQAAVMMQPIGLEGNRQLFFDLFDAWAADIKVNQPQVPDTYWADFRKNMFEGDFLFSASQQDVAELSTPMLLLAGDDEYHPRSVSHALRETLPQVEFMDTWKRDDLVGTVTARVEAFLLSHAGHVS